MASPRRWKERVESQSETGEGILTDKGGIKVGVKYTVVAMEECCEVLSVNQPTRTNRGTITVSGTVLFQENLPDGFQLTEKLQLQTQGGWTYEFYFASTAHLPASGSFLVAAVVARPV